MRVQVRVREGGRVKCKHCSKVFACFFSPVCSSNEKVQNSPLPTQTSTINSQYLVLSAMF